MMATCNKRVTVGMIVEALAADARSTNYSSIFLTSKSRVSARRSPSLPAWLKVMRFAARVDAHPDRYEPDPALGRTPKQRGHGAHHWSLLGSASAKDHDICEYARIHEYVLLTNDLDFPQILAHTCAARPSVVLLRGEPLVAEVRGGVLLQALAEDVRPLACFVARAMQ